MVFNSLDEVFDSISEIRRQVYSAVEGLLPSVASGRCSSDSWSAAETLDHIGRAEETIVSRIKQQITLAEAELAGPPRAPGGDPRSPAGADGFFRPISLEQAIQKAQGQKFKSPDPVAGRPDVSLEQALERLKRSRADLLSLRPQIESLDLSERRFPHFVFGDLNVYEWVAFIGMHERRHLNQIKETLSHLTQSAR